jgi:hypothetical protein
LQALQDNGRLPGKATVTFTRTTAKVCATTTPRDCSKLSDFELEGEKLSDYERDGMPLEGSISAGGASTEVLGTTLTALGAYTTSDGNLVVNVSVDSGLSQRSLTYTGNYQDPDGGQTKSSSQVSPSTDLRPGGTGILAFTFPASAPGGTLIVTCSDDASSESTDARLPIPVYSG